MEQLNINILIKEYETTIGTLVSENIQLKAYMKQLEAKLREVMEQQVDHPAPPAPPLAE